MLTVAYIGFGVSVREYHIPYVEGREDIRVKYVFRRAEDAPQFAAYEPFYPELTFTADLDRVLTDPEVDLVVVSVGYMPNPPMLADGGEPPFEEGETDEL